MQTVQRRQGQFSITYQYRSILTGQSVQPKTRANVQKHRNSSENQETKTPGRLGGRYTQTKEHIRKVNTTQVRLIRAGDRQSQWRKETQETWTHEETGTKFQQETQRIQNLQVNKQANKTFPVHNVLFQRRRGSFITDFGTVYVHICSIHIKSPNHVVCECIQSTVWSIQM